MCEICEHWPRILDLYKIRTRGGIPIVTNHHENCPLYNDSLIEVWKVQLGSQRCWLDNEQDAQDVAGSEVEQSGGETVSIVKEKMHREVFENLPEFDGF